MLLCTIRRSVGAKQAATLGVHEPLAFLGAWLAEAGRSATRNDHMTFKPSPAQTRKYAQRRGLIKHAQSWHGQQISIAFVFQCVFAFLVVSRLWFAQVVYADDTIATYFSQND